MYGWLFMLGIVSAIIPIVMLVLIVLIYLKVISIDKKLSS